MSGIEAILNFVFWNAKLFIMKKLIFGFVSITLLISCSQKFEKTVNKKQLIGKSNITTDPNLFIGKYKAKAMVLGMFHFSDSSLDTYKPKFKVDIMSKKRQLELTNLIERISKYKPTKILLERNRIEKDSLVNVEYQKFLKDDFDISDKVSEDYQIGFRLAKKLNHDKIYCSDAISKWFGIELDWDNYDEAAYLKSKGQFQKTNRYNYTAFYELGDSLKSVLTLREYLAWENNPENRLKDHQAYLTGIIEGAGDNYLGADNVGRWYVRNLRIFANAYDLTDFDKEERILLIYGSGHVWQLRQLFKDSPDFEYIEPNEYLK